jgi:hypothetical protein
VVEWLSNVEAVGERRVGVRREGEEKERRRRRRRRRGSKGGMSVGRE